MSSNLLGEHVENIKNLAFGLEHNKSIEFLSLNFCDIGKNCENFRYFSDALKINNSINHIDLMENSIGENPLYLKYLSETFSVKRNIIDLNLSLSNIVSFTQNDIYLQKIQNNKAINYLTIIGNKLPSIK